MPPFKLVNLFRMVPLYVGYGGKNMDDEEELDNVIDIYWHSKQCLLL